MKTPSWTKQTVKEVIMEENKRADLLLRKEVIGVDSSGLRCSIITTSGTAKRAMRSTAPAMKT